MLDVLYHCFITSNEFGSLAYSLHVNSKPLQYVIVIINHALIHFKCYHIPWILSLFKYNSFFKRRLQVFLQILECLIHYFLYDFLWQLNSAQATHGVSEYVSYSVFFAIAFILRVVYPKAKLDLFVDSLIQEGGKGNDEFPKVYHFIVVGVKDPEQVLGVDAWLKTRGEAELFIINHSIVFLTFRQLIVVQIEIIDFILCEGRHL